MAGIQCTCITEWFLMLGISGQAPEAALIVQATNITLPIGWWEKFVLEVHDKELNPCTCTVYSFHEICLLMMNETCTMTS